MNLWQLVNKEIRFRKVGFAIGMVSIAVAIASLVGSVTLLRAYEVRTEQILAERERETREEMTQLENDYRNIMRDMGYNVMILHEDQSIAAMRAAGYPEKTMPEQYVHDLVAGRIETLNHLLPVLQKKIVWPEREMEIILSGTPGQVPIKHKKRFLTADGKAYKNPVMESVPQGAINLGHGVAKDLKIREGDRVTLLGDEFVVHRVHPPQGNMDDLMVWCNLDVAQAKLDQPGQINAIFALECVCIPEELGRITTEVRKILSDTQVYEFSSMIVARAHARNRAAEAHETAIAAELEHREAMGKERQAFAQVLVPTVLGASGLWVFFLVLGNVRERRNEIGILRAIGVRQRTIAGIFLVKAAAIGLFGSIIGYILGVVVGAVWGGVPLLSKDFVQLFGFTLFLGAVAIAVGLCAVAGWVPAIRAAQQDPAAVLREE